MVAALDWANCVVELAETPSFAAVTSRMQTRKKKLDTDAFVLVEGVDEGQVQIPSVWFWVVEGRDWTLSFCPAGRQHWAPPTKNDGEEPRCKASSEGCGL